MEINVIRSTILNQTMTENSQKTDIVSKAMSLSVCSTVSQMNPKSSVFVCSCPATFTLSCYNSLIVDDLGGFSSGDVFKALRLPEERGWVGGHWKMLR